MKSTVSFQYGEAQYTFEFEEQNDKETLLKTIVLGNPPRKCPLIKDPNAKYRLEAKEVSGKHIYVEAVCIGKVNGQLTVAKSQLGTYESMKGYFWKTWELDEFANKRLRGESGNDEQVSPTTIVAGKSQTTSVQPKTEDEYNDLPF
jgi:hypothetical protein